MTQQVRVKSISWEAPDIASYELRPLAGGELPAFSAGAHIDLALGNGFIRSYSLLNSQEERHRYVIAVQRDRASRGGSRWIHENVRAGDVLTIAGPRNNFPLCETAQMSLFIAGGIGITPILSMIDRLTRLGRPWRLVYCARTRADAAFVEIFEGRAQVRFNFDAEAGGTLLDIAALVGGAPAHAHFYCCGPLPMLAAFQDATAGIEPARVHLEFFSPKEAPATSGGFTVVLAQSGRQVAVPAGSTILDALLKAGVEVPYACTEGICGSCETAVLEGVPDHRDIVLTDQERAQGKTMMICCSGSKSDRLVLDL